MVDNCAIFYIDIHIKCLLVYMRGGACIYVCILGKFEV